MKWSGFTSSKITDETRIRCSMTSGIKGTHKNYLAPEFKNVANIDNNILLGSELWHEGVGRNRSEIDHVLSDIFSAGCVFSTLLRAEFIRFEIAMATFISRIRGEEILWNSKRSHFAHSVILNMTNIDPAKRTQLIEVIKYLEPLQPINRLSLLPYNHQNEISKGPHSQVYRIPDFEKMELAVKKFEYFEGFFKENLEKLKKLVHPNVIHLHFFDHDNLECYFGMELCQTSLDRLFLPSGDPKKYQGPMPAIKNAEFCLQLAKGLEYIHKENLVHGSIKPSNILITTTTSDSDVWQIKLSDFGLTSVSRRMDQGNASSPRINGFQDLAYWLAPELMEARNKQVEWTFTVESDIFSAGSVLFYFCSQGCHLYGDDVNKIILNTLAGKRENLKHEKLKVDVFPMGLVYWMTAKIPAKRPELSDVIRHSNLFLPIPPPEKLKNVGRVADIKFSAEHVLGSGGQATVFVGFYKTSTFPIAVKRIGNMDAMSNTERENVYRERTNFEQLENINIVKLYGSVEDTPFLFLALEKCLTSLQDYCRKPLLYRGIVPMPSDCEVLLQMAEGLHFIHEKKIIHRDVKPANVLISYDKPAIIKWADFGMSRAVTTGSRTFTWSDLRGTERWMAPELIDENEQVKVKGSFKCDIFALGCVYFFFLVPGKHPFGDGSYNLDNVRKGNRVLLNENHFAYNIVKSMTEHDRNDRPQLSDVIRSLTNYKQEKIPDSEVTMEDVSETIGQSQGYQVDPTRVPNQFTWGQHGGDSGEGVRIFQGGASFSDVSNSQTINIFHSEPEKEKISKNPKKRKS